MALLSFFILFFSIDGNERQKLILNLAGQFQKDGAGQSALRSGTGGTGMTGGSGTGRNPSSLMQAISELDVSVEKDRESLIVHFPDNFFPPGKHTLKGPQENIVEGFLARIKPYQAQVNLVFEGHSDIAPLKRHKNDIVVDNFVLSSLRASSALMLAKKAGFEEKNLFIQADSSNTRNSRTLSVRIEPKIGEPAKNESRPKEQVQ